MTGPLIVYTTHIIRAGLDFQERVPILSVLGLPFQTVWARLKFGSARMKFGTRKVVYTAKFLQITNRTNFFGTRTIFIRAVPKIFGSINRRLYSEANGWSFWVFIVFGRWQITRIATKSLIKNLYWHFTGKKLPERKVFGSLQAPVNYRRNTP